MNMKIFLVLAIALFAVALAAPGRGRDGGGVRKKVVHHHWLTKPIPKVVYYTKVIPRQVPVPVYIPIGGHSSSGSGGDDTKIIGGSSGGAYSS